MSDCPDPRLHDLLGPYALGACPPDEREAVRAHLVACPACARELAELGGVREALLTAAPAESAPPELKARVMRQVHAEAELFRAARPAPGRPDGAATSGRRGLSRRVPLVAAAATAATLALAAGITGALIAGGDDGAPPSRTVPAQVDARAAPGAHALIVTGGGQARLLVDRLPSPGRSRVYQVWLQSGDAPPRPSDALFGVSRDGRGATVLPSLRGVDRVLVTSEPAGGSRQPSRPPVLSARV